MNLSLTLPKLEIPWLLFFAVAAFQLRKHGKLSRAVAGGLHAALGYCMVCIGAAVTPEATGALSRLMQSAFGIRGGVMSSEVFGAALLLRYGAEGIAVMLLAFGVNLLLARYTRLKGVFLTAHHLLYLALLTVALMVGVYELPLMLVIPLGAAVLGAYAWLSVAATRTTIERATGMPDVGMANSSSEAALIGRFLGSAAGSRGREYASPERRGGSAMKSIPLVAAGSTLIAYIALCACAGVEQSRAILGDGFLLRACLLRSLLYGAQIALLLYGIRMLLTSIVELFWSAADGFVRDQWRGLDVSIMIGHMPRAWEEGFWASCIGGLLATVIMILLRIPYVPLMSPTSFYFSGGLAGVCGNAYGKRIGARLAGLVTGVLATLAVGLMAAAMQNDLGVIFGETQYGIYGLLLEGLCRLLKWI